APFIGPAICVLTAGEANNVLSSDVTDERWTGEALTPFRRQRFRLSVGEAQVVAAQPIKYRNDEPAVTTLREVGLDNDTRRQRIDGPPHLIGRRGSAQHGRRRLLIARDGPVGSVIDPVATIAAVSAYLAMVGIRARRILRQPASYFGVACQVD